jgi:hypothetical protein
MGWAAPLALEENEYRAKMVAAGFENIDIDPTRVYQARDLAVRWRGPAGLTGRLPKQYRAIERFRFKARNEHL